jgi:hypothetical protein
MSTKTLRNPRRLRLSRKSCRQRGEASAAAHRRDGRRRRHRRVPPQRSDVAEFEPIIEPTVAAFDDLQPELLMPAHCTGWKAMHRLARRFPDAFVRARSGRRSRSEERATRGKASWSNPRQPSNEGPPPDHALRSASGRNQWQRFRLVSAVFEFGHFHRLPLVATARLINRSMPRPRMVDVSSCWGHVPCSGKEGTR